jgi:hypothetical protein
MTHKERLEQTRKRLEAETPEMWDSSTVIIRTSGLNDEQANLFADALHGVLSTVPNDLKLLLSLLDEAVEVLEGIAAVSSCFDEKLPTLSRGELVSIVDTDTSLARAFLSKLEDRG